MSNLGEFLEWISNNGVDVVLHGHKHVGHVAEFDPTTFAYGRPSTRVVKTLVVSAPAGRPSAGGPATVARLLRVEPPNPRVSGVTVIEVPHVGVGTSRSIASLESANHPLEDDVQRGLVRGATAQDVHAKLLALGESFHPEGLPLICRIEDGGTALQVPPTYPQLPPGVDDGQAWFTQSIEWWQQEHAGSAAQFNHGERIRDFASSGQRHGARIDQLKHAVEALSAKGNSTRAIAILVNPAHDLVDHKGPPFPAFTLAQFSIQRRRVNVLAYFRKQEIPHWWPINVGELAQLQQELVTRLTSARGDTLSAGSITTITAQAVRGGSVPRVSVPWLDQQLDAPLGVLPLVMPLFGGSAAMRARASGLWDRVFEDWEPQQSPPADGDPMPIRGLEELGSAIQHLAELHEAVHEFTPLRNGLDSLRTRCGEQAERKDDFGVHRTGWIHDWRARTTEIRRLVDDHLGVDA